MLLKKEVNHVKKQVQRREYGQYSGCLFWTNIHSVYGYLLYKSSTKKTNI